MMDCRDSQKALGALRACGAGETSTCCNIDIRQWDLLYIHIRLSNFINTMTTSTYPNPTEINLAQPTIRNYGLMLISHPQNVKNPATRNHDLLMLMSCSQNIKIQPSSAMRALRAL